MRRNGFTLIELLVAITILGILSALTFTMVNVTMDSDRISSASREVQSFLEGARNRAVYAKAPRGVRFIVNPDDPSTVSSMLYVGAPSFFTGSFETSIGSPGLVNVGASDMQAELDNLANRGLLTDGARIKVPRSGPDARWYTVAFNGTDWLLTKPFSGAVDGAMQFDLELSPAILPNQEPRVLARNVVIDLDNSRIPAAWTLPGATLEILFSPKGNVMGSVGASGRIHLVLSDVADSSLNAPLPQSIPTWGAGVAYAEGDWIVPASSRAFQFKCVSVGGGTSGASEPPEFSAPEKGATFTDGTVTWFCHERRPSLIVSVQSQTGNADGYAVHPVIPFEYAESGSTAK